MDVPVGLNVCGCFCKQLMFVAAVNQRIDQTNKKRIICFALTHCIGRSRGGARRMCVCVAGPGCV